MHEIKLDKQSLDIVNNNIQKLREIFPEIVLEDKIDFERLQDILGKYIERNEESYRFSWHGKSDAFRKSQTPSTGTLRPCIEESKNWDTTQNLYIEGDNLEVLKLLQKSYGGQVKMIYIDPPYNKDKDFVYSDKWSDPIKEYKRITGQIDDDGLATTSEEETQGGRHTNWLNMMYPRLRLARHLLKEDGVIFISIDDIEVHNLRKVCDEIFGEENFMAQLVWRTNGNFDNQGIVKRCHEYLLFYANNCQSLSLPPVIDPNISENSKLFKGEIKNTIVKNGPKNPVSMITLPVGFPCQTQDGVIKQRNDAYPHYYQDAYIKNNELINFVNVRSGWSSKDLLLDFIANDMNPIVDAKNQETAFILSSTGAIEVIKQRSLNQSHVISVLTNLGGSQNASNELKTINLDYFDFPKPTTLLEYLIKIGNVFIGECILDFFSGSATTAHAVMQLNAEDGGNRKFIMVQLPELIDRKDNKESWQFLHGSEKPENICEIGKERIRRAGEKIKLELKEKYDTYQKKQSTVADILEDSSEEKAPMNPDDLDIGFKVFKLDSSNLERWALDVGEDFYNLSAEKQHEIISSKLGTQVNNFVAEREDIDMLYEVMLKYGLDLSLPVETYTFNKKNVYCIGDGALFVSFADELDEAFADAIVAKVKELEPATVRVVVKDLAFMYDDRKTNFRETLKTGIAHYFAESGNTKKENQFEFITI